jgi:hypothetical protein
MIPNIHIHEQLMFERCQERQRAAAQQRLVAGLRRSHSSLARRLAGKLGVLLIALGTSLQRVALNGKQVVRNQGNV